jgi:hypothetical protein
VVDSGSESATPARVQHGYAPVRKPRLLLKAGGIRMTPDVTDDGYVALGGYVAGESRRAKR